MIAVNQKLFIADEIHAAVEELKQAQEDNKYFRKTGNAVMTHSTQLIIDQRQRKIEFLKKKYEHLYKTPWKEGEPS